MRNITEIQKVMTPSPRTIDFEAPLRDARQLMQDFAIRHLPVIRGAQVMGVISERDLAAAQLIEEKSQTAVHVRDFCHFEVYSVEPTTGLDEVVTQLARRGIGCALVVDAGRLLGIYTTVDACQGYGDLLRSLDLNS